LSAEGGEQLFVPIGFAHAFVTLGPDVEVSYKVSAVYAPPSDDGIIWSDPTIAIDWPLPKSGAILSDKDKTLSTLAEFDSPFEYNGQPLPPLIGY
jgi:dTDP-4-dehydrorhamnose 3,5-epimerase